MAKLSDLFGRKGGAAEADKFMGASCKTGTATAATISLWKACPTSVRGWVRKTRYCAIC